jgi:hypothetical protein
MTPAEDRMRHLVGAARLTYRPTHADRARVRAALRVRLEPSDAARPLRSGATKAVRWAATAAGLALLLTAGEARLRSTGATTPLDPPPTIEREWEVSPRYFRTPELSPTADLGAPPGRPEAAMARAKSEPPREEQSSLGEELAMLRAARVALREGEPQRSLAVLADLAARHPNGLLRGERMVAEILSSCAAGEKARARTIADQFLHEASGSPLVARVRESCAFDAPVKDAKAPTDPAPPGHSSPSL